MTRDELIKALRKLPFDCDLYVYSASNPKIRELAFLSEVYVKKNHYPKGKKYHHLFERQNGPTDYGVDFRGVKGYLFE